MNKAELIEAVAKQTGRSKAEEQRSLEAVVKIIQDTLSQKDELAHVHISGLGNFSRKSLAARTGRNPQTGEAIAIPAKFAPKFVASKALKEAVK